MDTLLTIPVGLVVLAALAVAVFWLQRRGYAHFRVAVPGRNKTEKRMQLLERLSLTPQHSLHLVQVEGRVILVASAPGSCSVLGPVDVTGSEGPC